MADGADFDPESVGGIQCPGGEDEDDKMMRDAEMTYRKGIHKFIMSREKAFDEINTIFTVGKTTHETECFNLFYNDEDKYL